MPDERKKLVNALRLPAVRETMAALAADTPEPEQLARAAHELRMARDRWNQRARDLDDQPIQAGRRHHYLTIATDLDSVASWLDAQAARMYVP